MFHMPDSPKVPLLLGVFLLLLPAAAAEVNTTEMKDSTGAEVAVESEMEITAKIREPIAQYVGRLRQYTGRTKSEYDVMKSLGDAQVIQEIVEKVAGYLSRSPDDPKLRAQFGEALALKHTAADNIFPLRRLFVYDHNLAVERLKKNQNVKYLSYDTKTGSISMNWPLPSAPDEPADMPLVVTLREAPLLSFETQIKNQLGTYGAIVAQLLKTDYHVHAYRVMLKFVRTAVDETTPGAPLWFREGTANTITLYTLGDLLGKSSALEAFSTTYKPAVLSRTIPLSDFFGWNEQTSEFDRLVFIRTATDAVMVAMSKGPPGYMGEVFGSLTKLPPDRQDTAAVFAAFLQGGKVDLQPLLKERLTKAGK